VQAPIDPGALSSITAEPSELARLQGSRAFDDPEVRAATLGDLDVPDDVADRVSGG
jgi:hypothetical protein